MKIPDPHLTRNVVPLRPIFSGLLLVMLLCLGITPASFALQDPEITAIADTAQTDTLKSTVLAGMGQLGQTLDTTRFHFTDFLWTDARSLADLFRLVPGVLLRDLGRPGQPDQAVVSGIDGRGMSFMMDGRPLTNPVTGVLNLYEIPIEFVNHLEWRTFEQGFTEGPNGSAGTVNIVSRQYNTSRPITKIRFMQGPYEHLLTDALFTQNITRSMNVLFGVQRHVSENRFVNSSYDSWNVRSRIRYNVTGRLNISLMDFYRKSSLGMNNGIDIDSTRSLGLDPLNDAEALVYSETATESQTRRDVTLAVMALALHDSLSPTQFNAYFSVGTREYIDPAGRTSGLFDRYSWEVHGLSIRQTLNAGPARVYAGGQLERRLAGLGPIGVRDNIMSAWYANAGLDLGFLRPEIMARAERNGDGQGFSWGFRTRIEPSDGMAVTAGVSNSNRFPTLQELNWPLYSFSGDPNLVEYHKIAHVSVDFTTDFITLSADLSRRTIENALLFKTNSSVPDFPALIAHSIPSLTIHQLSGSLTLRFRPWQATGGLTWTETSEDNALSAIHPRFILTGELSYRNVLLDGALEARFGLESRFVGTHTGARFFPATGIFAENTGKSLKAFSTIDVFGIFHIGDAFLTITWENPLGREFFTVYPFPAMGRNIRVGINWIFLN